MSGTGSVELTAAELFAFDYIEPAAAESSQYGFAQSSANRVAFVSEFELGFARPSIPSCDLAVAL